MSHNRIFLILLILFSLFFSLPVFSETLQNVKVSASSYETNNLEFQPENAIDGYQGTRWSSRWSDPQWISVDLGKQTLIDKIILSWEAAFAKSYQILISDDDRNWKEVYRTSSGDGGKDEIPLAPVSARYVKMNGTERGTRFGYSLYEFEIYKNGKSVVVAPSEAKNRIEIKDGWFYINGEKFFVKGVDYFSNYYDKGIAYDLSSERIDYDFKMIKEAGFNTVITYLTPYKMKIAKKYGLMVVSWSLLSASFCTNYRTRLDWQKNADDFAVKGSRDFNNILYYCLDNEPDVNGVYKQGEKTLEDCWHMLENKTKEVQPEAYTTVKLMPPNAVANPSMCDVISLNLYPDNPGDNSIGYSAYANWYKRKKAEKKPFIVSEYGWVDPVNLNNFGPVVMNELDQQIKAGACGSFFFAWRLRETEPPESYMFSGIIPNGQPYDYTIKPRQIYSDFQKYFEAVAIEPRIDGVYARKIPFEIYGTDKTGSISAEFDGKKIELKKQGKYWWLGELSFGPDSYGKKAVIIEAKDKDKQMLARKNINVYLCSQKKSLSVKIIKEKNQLTNGQPYEAKVVVIDEKGKRVPDQSMLIGVNQTRIDFWKSTSFKVSTDSNGEYFFKDANMFSGYYTLIAGADVPKKDIETYADVDISRVENNPAIADDLLNAMNTLSGWMIISDNGTTVKPETVDFKNEKTIEISYDFGAGNWVGMDEKILHDFSKYRSVKLNFRDTGIKNNIEFKVQDLDGSVFMTYIKERSRANSWNTVVISFNKLNYGWGGDRNLNLTNAKLGLAISRKEGLNQGEGKLTIGKIEMLR